MKSNASVVYSFILLISDSLFLIAAFVLAYIIRVTLDDRSLVNQISSDQYFASWIILLPIWLIIFALLGLYRKNVYEYRWREIITLLIGTTIGIMSVITYEFISGEPIFPARLVAVYGLALSFILLLFGRTLARIARMYMWRTGFGVNNILIIGNGEGLHALIKEVGKPTKTGQAIVAIGTQMEPPKKPPKTIFFGSYVECLEQIQQLGINTIVVTGVEDDSKIANKALATAQMHHVAYKYIPSQAGMLSNNVGVELFQGMPVVSVHQTALTGWGRIVKRLFDISASFIGMIILSPIYLMIAISIKISDGGPVIYKQARLSRFNTTIYIYKFRSNNLTYNGMSPEEAFKKMGEPQLIKKYRDNGDFLENDPRITTVGRFLRKTSLDELPQLFNVLKGNISLVGPRALVPQELSHYAYKDLILSVKSGITGLAQISGRRNIGFEERRALDLYYVQNWSFWLDIKILFRTVLDVLSGRGAK